MSRLAKVDLIWGDSTYPFRLRVVQLVELQEKCDAGPGFILERLATNRWKLEDVRETIRLGLIGGGLKPAQALKLVNRYVDDQPLQDNVNTAYAIVAAVLVGVEDEVLGKAEGETEKEEEMSSLHSQEEKSVSPQSMEQAS